MNSAFFSDKVVLITGSCKGIGRATALELLKRGAKVVINCRSKDNLLKAKAQLSEINKDNILAIQADITKKPEYENLLKETIKKFGKLDILINNAGLAATGTIENSNPVVFKTQFEINTLGSIYMTLAAIPYLKKTKGYILFISSLAALRGLPRASAYSASKMALTAFGEALKLELKDTGIQTGISYVSFTQNDPDKNTMRADGTIEIIEKRPQNITTPVDKTVNSIIRQIEKRKFKVVFSRLGKLLFFLNIFAPLLVEFIYLRLFKHLEKTDKEK